jgi:hypothetical protein
MDTAIVIFVFGISGIMIFSIWQNKKNRVSSASSKEEDIISAVEGEELERAREEKEKETENKKKLEELLTRESFLAGVIKSVRGKKMGGSRYRPSATLRSKYADETLGIQIVVSVSFFFSFGEKIESVSITSKKVPGVEGYSRQLEEFSDEELQRIDDWIDFNYGDCGFLLRDK